MPESRKRGMIVRARVVVTMDGAPIENGAVAISGDRIVDVGKFDQIKTRNSGSRGRSWRASAAAGSDQRPLSSRLHMFTRENSPAKIVHRLDPGH